jgi:hypothetical protein
MSISARLELAAGAFAAINDFNPVRPGETVTLWAAGEAADGALTASVGSKGFFRGRTGIEGVANAGPTTDQNAIASWTQPPQMWEADLVIQNTGAVVVQIMISKS